MTTALIGSTGFVGGTLRRQTQFDDLYHSTNIDSIARRSYDLVVCAGAPAEKWRANADPAADRERLDRLLRPLLKCQAALLILISTVDVYPTPRDVDETTDIPAGAGHAYGRHRRELEVALSARFPTLIIRLPALFGRGLKKNVVFDLLHGNDVEKVHADAVFQFYDLDDLWADISAVRRLGVDLVNFATEPVSVRDIVQHCFGRPFDNAPAGVPARYDVRSVHAPELGGARGYLRDRVSVLDAMRSFVASEQRAREQGE